MNILDSPPSSSSCSSSSSSSLLPSCPQFPPIFFPKPPSETTTGVRFLSVSASSLRVLLLHRRRINTSSSTWVSCKISNFGLLVAKSTSVEADASAISPEVAKGDVLKALSQIIDPDFGTDIVSCGFVKDLVIDEAKGQVSFRLELTTPACPIKDEFERKANEVVEMLPWVKDVKVTMSAQPARPLFIENLPPGLQKISSIVAVSSCKGGVGKSTVAVNLAYTLAGMGARVGIFDADVYGPSLPTMVSPENRLLEMNPEKRSIIPTEYLGVKLVSFGFAGQGRAIMRGPMVSGVINQLLTTTEWGELDYLIIDMPPGTGDIQLTLCQVVPLTAAVIVTTPQKLAFIDVAKGVRMFSKLKVPCVAVVENMCHFDADGKRYYPFGRGSGAQVVQQFGIPHLFDLPIRPTLSASGDSGMPEVVADPQGEVSRTFQELGVCVVQQCAKIRQQVSTAVTYDNKMKVIGVKVPDSDEEFYLHPATVRRNDRSAQSVDEWTGEQKLQYSDVPENIEPEEIHPMGTMLCPSYGPMDSARSHPTTNCKQWSDWLVFQTDKLDGPLVASLNVKSLHERLKTGTNIPMEKGKGGIVLQHHFIGRRPIF